MIVGSHTSKRGMIVSRNIILVDEPHQKSLASLVLINDYYRVRDEDYLDKTKDIQYYLDKRHEFLTEILERDGILKCHYCKHTNLEVGERLLADAEINNKNNKLATIDHVIPVSSGIDKLDTANWVVACRRCNRWKSNMSYDEFLKILPIYLANYKRTGRTNLKMRPISKKKKKPNSNKNKKNKKKKLTLQKLMV